MKISLLFICFVLMIFGTVYAADNHIQKGNDGSNLENANAYERSDTIGINSTTPNTEFSLQVFGYFKATGISTFNASGATYLSVVRGADQSVGTGAEAATISGGRYHEIGQNVEYSTVGGGNDNDIYSDYATICGGLTNQIGSYSDYGFIGGGQQNDLGGYSDYSTIVGGYYNRNGFYGTDQADYSVIGGGRANIVTGGNSHYSAIGGGRDNQSKAKYATVCGGYSNVAGGWGATVWGYNNDATGDYSTAGGAGVDATHYRSTAIGYYSYATANYSTALGYGAYAEDAYSFVWADGGYCYSSDTDQFRVCARNGAWFSEEVSALCITDRPGECSKGLGSFPDLETAYDSVMSTNPSTEDPSQLDYENLDPFISSEGPGGEISRNLSATVTANNEVIKDLIARIAQLEQSAARVQ